MFRKDEHLIPFGIGKRYCIGEALAKVTLLYFLAGILLVWYDIKILVHIKMLILIFL